MIKNKKVYIINENQKWIEPISSSLEKANISYEEWFVNDKCAFDIYDNIPDGLFFNRLSPSAHIRGNANSYHFITGLVSFLEINKKRIINGSSSIYFELNKVKQYSAMQAAGILIPKTSFIYRKENIFNFAKEESFPLIIKPNIGGSGQGVIFVKDKDCLHNAVLSEDLYSVDDVFIVQEYIKPANNYVVRSEFIDKKFIYSVRIRVDGDNFNLCPADSCNIGNAFCPIGKADTTDKFEIINQKPFFIDKYIEIMNKFDIDIAGIEHVEDISGKQYVYDFNTNTNYNRKAEEKIGFSAYDKLAEYIKRSLENCT